MHHRFTRRSHLALRTSEATEIPSVQETAEEARTLRPLGDYVKAQTVVLMQAKVVAPGFAKSARRRKGKRQRC